MSKRKPAFLLGEALITLSLLSGMLVLEYEQLSQFKQQEQKLSRQYDAMKQDSLDAMTAWHAYAQK
ncbi:hypothetical protein D0501_01550 [Leuconostoc holzapfelii]|uniref:Uncharacterized protein n=1 Tax=Leuconostoc holzapfelii TaxID=434464 RepID=A0ABT2NTU5_9LACO|nr:hypothetical protein [Leuconostoc holzapfelii]MCT8388790.1 hypothetical protein [Leuconostoc holzapfelii]